MYISNVSGARVTGVTLSKNQLKTSNARARKCGCDDQVEFRLQDYRQIDEIFDRIVSVGMLEHVGAPQLRTFFDTVNRLLNKSGVALIHVIGRSDGPGVTNPWIDKYIFPGGYAPAMSELLPIIEKAGLYVTDIEVLRLHYAETLKLWRQNFRANSKQIEKDVGARFIRLWEFYLTGAEMAFRYQGQAVFQIQLAKDASAVPITRDYLLDWERFREKMDRADRKAPLSLTG
jgi:cyclopropane-fatty-acyl-phospholipid synthase